MNRLIKENRSSLPIDLEFELTYKGNYYLLPGNLEFESTCKRKERSGQFSQRHRPSYGQDELSFEDD